MIIEDAGGGERVVVAGSFGREFAQTVSIADNCIRIGTAGIGGFGSEINEISFAGCNVDVAVGVMFNPFLFTVIVGVRAMQIIIGGLLFGGQSIVLLGLSNGATEAIEL